MSRARTASAGFAPEALRGQTITLSNFGMLGGRHAALVVIPPQVAILGAGRAPMVVALEGRGPEPRTVLPLSLTFDHRAVTGGEAARFLAAVIADLEAPGIGAAALPTPSPSPTTRQRGVDRYSLVAE